MTLNQQTVLMQTPLSTLQQLNIATDILINHSSDTINTLIEHIATEQTCVARMHAFNYV